MPSHTSKERDKRKNEEKVDKKRLEEQTTELSEKRGTVADRPFIPTPAGESTGPSIGDIEKRVSQLMAQGLTEKAARSQAGRDFSSGLPFSQGERTVEEAQAAKEELTGQLRGEGLLEAPPERVELDVEPRAPRAEGVPVLGPAAGALTTVVLDVLRKRFDIESVENDPAFQTLIQDPQTARDIILQEIQQEVVDQGLKGDEAFGTFIEAIPVAGGLVAKYASGLIATPGGNAAIVFQNIQNEKERALNIAEMVRSGRLSPLVATDRLNLIEDNIIRLEQRLFLLINASPTLRANPDRVNQMETEILRAKERVEDARVSAAIKLIEPTDSQLLLTFRELRQGNLNI